MTHLQKFKRSGHFHKWFKNLDSPTQELTCICGAIKDSKHVANNKYNAKSTIYNGYGYDSAFEAQHAMELDWRLKAGQIKAWDRQFPVRIEVYGEHILTTKVDFRVHENDGSFTLEETKGFETADYRIKKRLIEVVWLKEHLDYSYVVIKESSNLRKFV